MTDAELDRMYECACAEDWEEQNSTNIPGWEDAIAKLAQAETALQEACDFLAEAAGSVDGSIEVDRINSLLDEVGFLRQDIQKQEERMKTA